MEQQNSRKVEKMRNKKRRRKRKDEKQKSRKVESRKVEKKNSRTVEQLTCGEHIEGVCHIKTQLEKRQVV